MSTAAVSGNFFGGNILVLESVVNCKCLRKAGRAGECLKRSIGKCRASERLWWLPWIHTSSPSPSLFLHPGGYVEMHSKDNHKYEVLRKHHWEWVLGRWWWGVRVFAGSRWQNSSLHPNNRRLTGDDMGSARSNGGSHFISCEHWQTEGCYHRFGTDGTQHFLHTRAIGFLLLFSQSLVAGSLGLIQEQNGDSVF